MGAMSDIEDQGGGMNEIPNSPGGADFNASQELPFVQVRNGNGDLGFVKGSASSHSHKNSGSLRQAQVIEHLAP